MMQRKLKIIQFLFVGDKKTMNSWVWDVQSNPWEGIRVLPGTERSQQMFGHPARISVPLEVFRTLGGDIPIDPALRGGMLYPVWHWKAWRSPRWSWKVLLWREISGTSYCDRNLTHSNLIELPFSINWIYILTAFLATTFHVFIN